MKPSWKPARTAIAAALCAVTGLATLKVNVNDPHSVESRELSVESKESGLHRPETGIQLTSLDS